VSTVSHSFQCLHKRLLLRSGLPNDKPVYGLLYADDSVVLAESKREAQLMLDHLVDWAWRNEATFNVKKCQTVVFGGTAEERRELVADVRDLRLNGELIP